MPLARRLRLRLGTKDGPAIYAERAGGAWVLSLPGGIGVTADGDVAAAVALMRRLAAERCGGAGRLMAESVLGGWEPYAPGVRGRSAEKRRRRAAA